ncbi:MAG: hypothetical protein ACUVQ8_00515 [Nitrososphaeria archaeon]
MSTIKDLVDEEKKVRLIINEAENRAKIIIDNTRRKVKELIKSAESDESAVAKVIVEGETDIANKKEAILKESDGEAERIEYLCKKNLKEAIEFVIDSVLGADHGHGRI